MTCFSRPALCALLAMAALLGACGGELNNSAVPAATAAPSPSDSGAPTAPATPPDAPSEFRLTAARGLHFRWAAAAGASEYRLLEDPDGVSGYAQIASLPAGSSQFSLEVLLATRIKAHYRLQACNSVGCSDSPVLTLPDSLAQAASYLKASNTEPRDEFGGQVALSADGRTLAVAALLEDSAATGVNGNQGDNSIGRSGAVYVFIRGALGWQQEAYLKASNPGVVDLFGFSLALSADGDTLAVGVPNEDSAATGVDGNQADNSQLGSGAVYVFTRSAGAWQQQAYLKAANTDSFDAFGLSVALSADGDTLAVGAPSEDAADNSRIDSGAAYVFTRSQGVWQASAYLKAADAQIGDLFGSALALSADGRTLAIGAPMEDGDSVPGDPNATDADSGAVYVFTRSTGPWSQQAYLKASKRGAQDQFGNRLALSADGLTLAVGVPLEDSAASGINGDQSDTSAPNSGAVYVFSQRGGNWQQDSYLKAAHPDIRDQFGTRLALSSDGRVLAVAAPLEASTARGVNGNALAKGSTASGAVYLFTRQTGPWRQQAYVKAANADANDHFGASLALSAAGDVLAVGAPNESSAATGANADPSDNGAANSGAVYLY